MKDLNRSEKYKSEFKMKPQVDMLTSYIQIAWLTYMWIHGLV